MVLASLAFVRAVEELLTTRRANGPQSAIGFMTLELIKSERILLVEDNEHLREIPVKFLSKQGYEVVEARSGKQAIEHLKDGQSFDLLFTDIVMPGGMNGVEVADEAKRIQPGIKVLYTSGYAEYAIVHNGILDSGVILLNKPYSREELLDKVRAILDSGDD